jgi:hypothetical protein
LTVVVPVPAGELIETMYWEFGAYPLPVSSMGCPTPALDRVQVAEPPPPPPGRFASVALADAATPARANVAARTSTDARLSRILFVKKSPPELIRTTVRRPSERLSGTGPIRLDGQNPPLWSPTLCPIWPREGNP